MSRIASIAASLLAALPAADIVHLKNGKQVEGRIVEEGFSYLRIETARGVTEIDTAEIERIERKPWTPPKGKKKIPEPEPPLPDPPKVPLEAVVRDPFKNFRLLLPKDWKAGPAGGGRYEYDGPASEGLTPTLKLRIEFDTPFDEVVRAEAESAGAEPQGVRVGGRPAKRLLADAALRVVVDAAGRRVFIFSFDAPKALFDKLLETVDAVIGSLRVFPYHDLTDEQKLQARLLAGEVTQHLSVGRHARALEAVEKLRELIPHDPDLHKLYAAAHAARQDWKAAAEALEEAVRRDPEFFEYRYYLSNYLATMRRTRDAEKHARAAAHLAPWSQAAWVNLGNVLVAAHKHREAEESYRRALDIDPKSTATIYNLGVLYELDGRPEDAERAYLSILEIDPNHAHARQGLARLRDAR